MRPPSPLLAPQQKFSKEFFYCLLIFLFTPFRMIYSLSITIVWCEGEEGGGAWDPLIAPMIYIIY